ncbi:unnamed protein product [Lampetra fluviatilis]
METFGPINANRCDGVPPPPHQKIDSFSMRESRGDASIQQWICNSHASSTWLLLPPPPQLLPQLPLRAQSRGQNKVVDGGKVASEPLVTPTCSQRAMGENGEISAEFTQEMARLRKLVSHLETQNAELRRRGSGAAAATHSAGEAHAGAAGRHSAKSDKKRSDTDTAAPHRAGEVQTVGNQARCNGGVMPSGSPTAQSGAQNEDGVVAAAATADTLDDVVMLDLQRTDVVEEDTWLYTSPSRKPTRDGDALEWSRRVLDNPSPKMREATLALARRLEKDTFSNTTVSGEMVAPGTSKRMGRLGSLTDVESVARQQEEALRLECSTSSVFATRGSSPSRHGLVSPSSQEFPSGVPVSPHRSASTPREPTSRGDPSREPARTPGLDVSSDWSRSTRAQREHVSYDTTPRELARDPAPRERAPRDRAPQDLIRRDRSMSKPGAPHATSPPSYHEGDQWAGSTM